MGRVRTRCRVPWYKGSEKTEGLFTLVTLRGHPLISLPTSLFGPVETGRWTKSTLGTRCRCGGGYQSGGTRVEVVPSGLVPRGRTVYQGRGPKTIVVEG